MIVTVTPNPAVDVTYGLPEVRIGETLRPQRVDKRAGGKGVNVARVLHSLGEPVVALGIAGGANGDFIARELGESGLANRFVPVAGECRQTVTLRAESDGSATIVNEPGPELSAGEWRACTEMVAEALDSARVLVLSGSLPPGVPVDGYAELVRLAERAGVPAILDTSGPALAEGLAARPRLVKPNDAELAELPGSPDPGAVHRKYGCAVVTSYGAEGLLGVDDTGAWRARPPETVHGNPTGAGDACVAALAMGLATGRPFAETLTEAVALSAAAVRAPLAGSVDLEYYRAIRARVTTNQVEA